MRTYLFVGLLTLTHAAGAAAKAGTPEGKRLIQTNPDTAPEWMTVAEVEKLIAQELNHFMDITDYPNPPEIRHPKGTLAFPSQLFYQRVVAQITPRLSAARMEAFLHEFSSFHNRYYNNQYGRQSSEWLQAHLGGIVDHALANGYTGTVSVQAVPHSWPQNSVVARIEGSDPVQRSQVMVFGAHQDSINSGNPSGGQAPGADDDGSGVAVLVEILLVLLEAGFVPRRTLELQFYAAEEVGLRGSQDIAQDYNARGVDVLSMVNLDCVGYYAGAPRREIGVITDYVDPAASEFLRIVIDEYSAFSWKNTVCGYACSDHASWTRAGYPASMPEEIVWHPAMHTIRDTTDTVDFDYLVEFGKIAVGHAVELGLATND